MLHLRILKLGTIEKKKSKNKEDKEYYYDDDITKNEPSLRQALLGVL